MMKIKIEAAQRLRAAHRINAYPYQAEDYVASLLSQGYKPLGEGYHGIALTIPGSSDILKIGPTEAGDSMSYTWLQWAAKNQNPWVPKISSLKNSRKGFYLCCMERLTPCTRGQITQVFDDTGISNILSPSRRIPDRWDLTDVSALSQVADKALHKTLTFILKTAVHWPGRHLLDITEENLMHRGSQLVFVDPLS